MLSSFGVLDDLLYFLDDGLLGVLTNESLFNYDFFGSDVLGLAHLLGDEVNGLVDFDWHFGSDSGNDNKLLLNRIFRFDWFFWSLFLSYLWLGFWHLWCFRFLLDFLDCDYFVVMSHLVMNYYNLLLGNRFFLGVQLEVDDILGLLLVVGHHDVDWLLLFHFNNFPLDVLNNFFGS